MKAKLILQDGLEIEGQSFGYEEAKSGELVFSTGMVGYPEFLTDPSYEGQILVLTYPIIGNYGVPDKRFWESSRIHVAGLIVNQYIDTPSHFQSKKTLSQWLKEEKIPALEIKDTRLLTQILRDKGVQLAKIVFKDDINFYDPSKDNLVDRVSAKKVEKTEEGLKTVVLIDCGVKENIKRSLLKRNVRLITVPWE
jgi:carbamoyl-phosphate synthase small subunit